MLYPVVIEPGNETEAFGVVVPDIKGCFSADDSYEEAIANVKEVIQEHLDIVTEDGGNIPEAGTIETHIDNPDYKGWVWAIVDIDITPYLGKSKKINVTLADILIKKIDGKVANNAKIYKSRSGFLQQAALHELDKTG